VQSNVRVRDERTLRVADVAKRCGADWALLTSPDAVFYATQHAGIIETGPSPFAGGPSIAFVSADASSVGLLVNNLEERAASSAAADTVIGYVGIATDAIDLVEERYARALDGALAGLSVGGVVAVEAATCTARVAQAVTDRGGRIVYLDSELHRARSTKTAEEIEQLRWAAHIVDLGQRAALAGARAGRSELEVWADLRLAMEQEAGERLPVSGDLTSGIANTASISGSPTARVLAEDDPILCDLAPRVRGYWGDSCNTIVVGEPTPEFMHLYRTTKQAIEVAADTLRPGITMHDFDAGVRSVFHQAGLHNLIHMGHSIGTGPHEWPRIVPGQQEMIHAGMVLMLEPGAYEPGLGGVRLEWMFLVTENGNEVLSDFPLQMHP
jgi:Xaa-Pro dipeptidase